MKIASFVLHKKKIAYASVIVSMECWIACILFWKLCKLCLNSGRLDASFLQTIHLVDRMVIYLLPSKRD